ncbi:MAG: ABC transporter permease subunit [bacterium]|nr:ABC transporter permease subunit [bacterium]
MWRISADLRCFSVDLLLNNYMHKLLAIAHNTFKETIRDRILYNILIFSILLIAFSHFLIALDIGGDEKIVVDLSLACISIFGVLIAIFIGIGLVYKEIEKRTIYTILSKPVSRPVFLLGKYLGLLMTLLVNVAIMTAVMYAVLAFTRRGIDLSILKAVFLIYIELMLITAISFFFSSFTTPTMAAIFSLSFFIIGHVTETLEVLGQKSGVASVKYLTSGIYHVLPDLNYFNIRAEIVHSLPVTIKQIWFSAMYGVFYIAIFYFLAIMIFSRKDFK